MNGRRIGKTLLWVIPLCVLGLMMAPQLLVLLVKPLAGLVTTPLRLMSHWHPSPAGMVLFILASIIVLAGTHALAAWLFQARQACTQKGDSPIRHWRLPYTICALGICFGAFLAVVSVVLIAHQTYWLRHSPEPWLVNRSARTIRQIELMNDLLRITTEHQWATLPVRQTLMQDLEARSGGLQWELYQPIFLERAPGELQAILMVPRRPIPEAPNRMVLISRDSGASQPNLNELPQVLTSLGVSHHNVAAQLKPFPVGQ